MSELKDQIRRAQLSDGLRQQFEASLLARVERHLRASHHPIVSNTSFAPASAECVDLFRDGHFYGCISLCQAVGEALIRHMCVCEFGRAAGSFEKNVRALRKRDRIEGAFEKLCDSLWEKRNDYHHLNPSIATDLAELEEIALGKIRTLAKLEGWVFEYGTCEGRIEPTRPKYWRRAGPDALSVYLRCEP